MKPVNRVARRVVSPGTHYEPSNVDISRTNIHSMEVLPTKSPNQQQAQVIGVRFGHLVVIGVYNDPSTSASKKGAYVVRCTCGAYEVRRMKVIREASPNACCYVCKRRREMWARRPRAASPPQPSSTQRSKARKGPKEDFVGRIFHRLTVLRFAGSASGGKYCWECQCECGKVLIARGTNLISGKAKSCGCYRSDPTVRRAARMQVAQERRIEIAEMGGKARARQEKP